MIVEFPYQSEKSKLFGTMLRPVAVVKLKQADRVVPVEMYVDSGADVTVIPRRLGEFLGFVIEQGEISEICGIGDAVVPIIVKNTRMNIGEREFDARIAWAMINDVPPLLGRLDVFDRFDIEFKQNEKKVLFKWV